MEDKQKLSEQFNSGAGWFYWIAGLSFVNVVMTLINGTWGFVFGLGITELIDYFTYVFAFDFGITAYFIGVSINCIILGVFVVFGKFAKNGHGWSFIVGMTLYALDGLLLAWLGDYMSALFHLYPLYMIYKGFEANKQLLKTVDSELTEVQINFRNEMREAEEQVD